MAPNASSTGIESLSSYPRVAATAPLEVATAGKPAFTTNRALATSHALGSTNGRGPAWRRRSASARSARPPTSCCAPRRAVLSGNAFIITFPGQCNRRRMIRLAPKLIGRVPLSSRDDDEDKRARAGVAEAGCRKPCDRDHRAAPKALACPRPALELELSLLDDHDRIGQLTRLHAKLEPRRNLEDTPGEALGERAAKQRAGALVRGHHGLSGRPKAGKSSGYRKKGMSPTT